MKIKSSSKKTEHVFDTNLKSLFNDKITKTDCNNNSMSREYPSKNYIKEYNLLGYKYSTMNYIKAGNDQCDPYLQKINEEEEKQEEEKEVKNNKQ